MDAVQLSGTTDSAVDGSHRPTDGRADLWQGAGAYCRGKWFEHSTVQDKTVTDLLERYLRDHSKPNKAATTHNRDRSLAAHLIRAFGTIPLDQLRPAQLSDYKQPDGG